MLRLRYQLVWRLLQHPAEVAPALTLEVKDNDPDYDVDKKPPATRGATGGFCLISIYRIKRRLYLLPQV